ncbi:putative inorganic phosphate cotransporter [Anthonomus grandis grandis]|uniref:putative inorganic phosphate cotransporter n=1 Tax=Anthonomus grandis grandis TaxID=2921223 RepID=UPI002165F8D1|nr:putative inorganic phosphate cotransporter [Anthonomus grandis grandis]
MAVEKEQYNYTDKQKVYGAVNKELTETFLKKEKFEEDLNASVPKIGYRHLQVFLLFLLCFTAFGFRVNLSVAIVAMTDPSVNESPEIPSYPHWTDKNVVLSAFFWGYVLPQIFAGWAATKVGAKWILICTYAINSVFGFGIPYAAAYFGSKGVMVCRMIQGLTQGFIYPSVTAVLSHWVVPQERSRLGTIVYAAGPSGTILGMFLTGMISSSSYGWPWAFYSYGIIGIIWCFLMIIFGYNSPSENPYISKAEKYYIESNLGHTDGKIKHPTPWKAILTSKPVWALFITQTGNNYAFWTLFSQIPSYMNYVMHFNMKDNGLLSSLPYIVLWILSWGIGFTSDFVINKGILSRTASRKTFNSLGQFLPSIALVVLGFIRPDQPIVAVILLITAVGTNAFHFCGFSVNYLDLSPNHSALIIGLCNGFSQITGIVAPLVVQCVVTNSSDPLQWRIVFFIAAAISTSSAIAFIIFGSAKVQPWNEPEKHVDEEKI